MRSLSLFLAILDALTGNPRRQHQRTVDSEGRAQQDQDAGPQIIELRIPKGTLEHIAAEEDKSRCLHKQQLWIDRKRLWVEGLTLVFVICGAVGALVSLYFLKASVDAAKQAAVVAATTASLASTQMVTEQRAWLVITRHEVGWIPNGPALVAVSIENIGKTPAKAIDGCIRVQILTSGQSPDFDYTPGKGIACYQQTIRVLNPGAPAVQLGRLAALESTRDAKAVTVDSKLATAIGNRDAHIVMHGRLTFKDVFDIDHWIQFCEWSVADGSAIPKQGEVPPGQFVCSAYNDFDNNTGQGQPHQ